MITIKRKILTPFLVLIIVIPLTTLLIFNIVMRIYVNKSARLELINTVQIIDTLVKKELSGTLFEFNNDEIDKAFSNIYAALRASKLAANTEVLLFNKNSELIYPTTTTGSFIDDALLKQISQRLSSSNKNEVHTVQSNGKNYIMTAYKLTKLPLERTPYVAFVSSLNVADDLINTINAILLLIMLLGIGIGIFIANRVSNRISKSVTNLCKITDDIGRGGFSMSVQNTDITELSMLHQSINDMSSRLEAYDKAQKAFLQNASHELRTPLMSIQGYAEGITNGVLHDTNRAAEIIISESKRLNTLVDELLTLSRIDNQAYCKQLEKLNLCDMLKEYVQRIEGFAIKDKKQLVVNLPDNSLYVLANDSLLSQAVINVASNCIRFSKSVVNISLLESNQYAIIRISDDGNGISDDDLPHIFERFYKGKGGNLGLGLAIAKSAIEFMSGSIIAYSTDTGAVFEIQMIQKPH